MSPAPPPTAAADGGLARPWRPYACLAVGVLSLGFAGLFVSWAETPGTVSSFWRTVIASAVLLPAFLRRRARAMPRGARAWLVAAGAGVLFALDLAFWAEGVVLGGPTEPTLLANVAPVWVGLGALVLFRERLGLRFWLGLALALAGAAWILRLEAGAAPASGRGALLGLVASVFYAGYFLATQRARRSLDSFSTAWVSVSASAVTLLLVCLLLGESLGGFTQRAVASFLGLGLVTQVCGYLAISYALGHLPATLVAPTLLGQPIATALLSYWLVGERFGAGHVAGGAAVLAGVWVVHAARPARG